MTGGAAQSEGRKYKDIFSILSDDGREKPYNRICLHSYRQRGMQEYAWSFNSSSMLSRFVTGDYANCVSEQENFPHSLYTKSVNYLRYQMLSSAPLCLKGDTFSIFEFNGNGAINYERYAKMLKEIKPYLSRLDKIALKPSEMLGVKVLVSENSSYTVTGAKSFGGLNPFDSWLFAYLEQIGIACAYTMDENTKGEVIALSGQVLRNYSNDVIKALFENNFVILTADNIDVLRERGLLSLIGVKGYDVHDELTGTHAMEELATGEEVFGVERLRATAQFFCGKYYRIDYDDSPKKVYTRLIDCNEKEFGAGICVVNNALIFPYANTVSDQRVPISLLCPLREYAIKQALTANEITQKELFFLDEENVCMYVFDKEDISYLVCVNFSDDDYDKLHFQCNRIFEQLKIFTPDNDTVRPVSYICANGEYSINHKLKGQQSYVLVGYKRKRN